MTLNIDLPDNLDAALKAQARAKGISEAGFVRQVLEQILIPAVEGKPGPPFETGYGMWAKYGPALSAEEIDENRRDMFRNFAQEF
jgi:hypothetical protein